MEYEPLFDRVLARPIKQVDETESGIFFQDSEQNSTKKARVLAVGKGSFEDGFFQEMMVKKDDIFLYEDHTVAKFFEDNKEYILIKQTDILAVER